jgi:hypothetical protein
VKNDSLVLSHVAGSAGTKTKEVCAHPDFCLLWRNYEKLSEYRLEGINSNQAIQRRNE